MIEHWPPSYSIRKSVRARKILLRVKPLHGLEVIIPEHRKRFNIEHILEENRYWIEKTIKKNLLYEETTLNPIVDINVFTPIECRATGESWEICYKHKPNRKKLHLNAVDVDKILVISGHIENHIIHAEHKRLLTRWLMQYAYRYLVSWITELSELTGLIFTQLKIRGQTTLWGSCNAKKMISLNYKLIFLPNALVRHVLLHELCHLQHLNHSQCFWNLLEKWDPEYQSHKKLLKNADTYIPLFLRI